MTTEKAQDGQQEQKQDSKCGSRRCVGPMKSIRKHVHQRMTEDANFREGFMAGRLMQLWMPYKKWHHGVTSSEAEEGDKSESFQHGYAEGHLLANVKTGGSGAPGGAGGCWRRRQRLADRVNEDPEFRLGMITGATEGLQQLQGRPSFSWGSRAFGWPMHAFGGPMHAFGGPMYAFGGTGPHGCPRRFRRGCSAVSESD